MNKSKNFPYFGNAPINVKPEWGGRVGQPSGVGQVNQNWPPSPPLFHLAEVLDPPLVSGYYITNVAGEHIAGIIIHSKYFPFLIG